MKRILMVAVAAVVGACGGGGGDPGPVHRHPVVQLVSPDEASAIDGTATVTVKATGDGVDIASLAFTAPSALAGATPTLDAATHSATLVVELNSADYPNGNILTLDVKAVDVDGYQATASYHFVVRTAARPAVYDPTYASFIDEAGVQLAQSASTPAVALVDATTVPGTSIGQYVYANTTKKVIADGASINRIVSRGWTGATPSAAVLNANPYNVPVMRILVDREDSAPAISSAKGLVTVGTQEAATFDLVPDSSSPSGQAAFLLPLASTLVPDLAKITTATDVKVSVALADALGNAFVGGPWTVHVTPIAPPLVASVDAYYSTQTMQTMTDARSAYPYRGQDYAALWSGSTFSQENGVRVYHVVVTNPDNHPVSVGAILGGAKSWALSESWVGHLISSTTYRTCTQTCTPGSSGPPSCSMSCTNPSFPKNCASTSSGGVSTPVAYSTDGASWSCVAVTYDSGPSTLSVAQSGVLTTTAYVAGTNSAATVTASNRYLVPAASANNPGRLDIYVVRPINTNRGSAPALSWTGSAFETPRIYLDINQACTIAQYTAGTCTYYQKSWDRTMTGATETISGTIAIDAQAYDDAGATEVGPSAPALSARTLTSPIVH